MAEPLSSVSWLQDWYSRQCDGEWEHSKGIKIDTLDNPGWKVEIDLSKYGAIKNAVVRDERNSDQWLFCEVREAVFEAFGAPNRLNAILDAFRAFVTEIEGVTGTVPNRP